MELFRISLAKHSTLSASGRAGRWNSNGVEMIYTASSRSLACLENIVHRNKHGLTDNFRIMVIFIPDNISRDLVKVSALPANWHLSDENTYTKCRVFGDKWINDNSSVILEVPSAIVKDENNFLINPSHDDFKEVRLVHTEPFFFDPRIKS
jgi:RES domain-containing protein